MAGWWLPFYLSRVSFFVHYLNLLAAALVVSRSMEELFYIPSGRWLRGMYDLLMLFGFLSSGNGVLWETSLLVFLISIMR